MEIWCHMMSIKIILNGEEIRYKKPLAISVGRIYRTFCVLFGYTTKFILLFGIIFIVSQTENVPTKYF